MTNSDHGQPTVASRLKSLALDLRDARHDIRHGFVQIGPLYITTWQRHLDAMRNGAQLGRDYERGQHRQERAAVATMLSAIQESLTRRQAPQ